MRSERSFAAIAAVAALAVALAYLPVLDADFVWDDWQIFIANPALRLPELVWAALWEPILPGTSYLRPVALASFAGQFMTVGVDPSIAHGVNLALHAANTLLVGLIAGRLTAFQDLPARGARVLVAALLYGLHPALIEMVAWVSGRFDLLVTFFVLLALFGYITRVGWRRDLWVGGCFLLAAFSKEMAAMVPVLLFLLFLGRQHAEDSWATMIRSFWSSGEWRLYAVLASVAIFVLTLRFTLFGHVAHQDAGVNAELGGVWHHLAFIGQTLIFYAKTSVWPFAGLSPQHPFDVAGMGATEYWAGILALAVFLVFLAVSLVWRRWPALLLVGWGIALVPVLNLLPLTIGGSIGSERFLALPLVFLALSLVMLRPPPLSPAMHRAMPFLLGGFVALFLAVALANIRVTLPLWQNELSLWAWAYARFPESPAVQANYAAAATRFGDLARAEALFDDIEAEEQEMRGTMTTRQAAMLKLARGEFLVKTGRNGAALEIFHEALALSPVPPHEYLRSQGVDLRDLAQIQVDDATFFYRTVYWNLALAYVNLGRYEDALDAAIASLLYAPTFSQAWLLKAFALYGLDRWEEGEEAFAEADRYYTDDGRQEARLNRNDVLKQLCALPTPPVQVCGHWDIETAAAIR